MSPEQLARHHQDFTATWFDENIAKHLRLYHGKPEDPIPFLENRSLYFAFRYGKDEVGLVNIPSDQLPRFVVLEYDGKVHGIAWMDDILRVNLGRWEALSKSPDIYDNSGAWAIKVSRDAEMYIEDEFAGDLVEKIRRGLKNREAGLPTRFLYDENMPEELRQNLMQALELAPDDVVPGAAHHNFNDLFQFPNALNRAEWENENLPPQAHPELEGAESIMSLIREKDRILHFPYQKFDYIPQWLEEAASDEKVRSIKITLYRVAGDSAVAKSLIKAAENGKKVTAFLEIKARFDEASNLHWGAELEKAGVNVIYSYPGIKVHTKLFVIERMEEGESVFYAYLGTGNFNEKTAKIYCDHALLTADKRLAQEALQVFEVLERRRIITKTKHLLVAPFSLRDGFEDLMDAEIEAAEAGRDAWVRLKMNSLEDKRMVEKVAEAVQAGVKVDMVVRGIFCLNTEALNSLNFRAVSIVDRFLEHARIYQFCNGGEPKIYIASADWMSRNLDRRIELAVPIYDEDVYSQLERMLLIQLSDNTKARILEGDQMNGFVARAEPEVQAQLESWRMCSFIGEAMMEIQAEDD